MGGNDNGRGGAPVTAEELFDHVATLAGLTYSQLQDTEASRDEARRTMASVQGACDRSQANVKAIADEMRQKYAPEGVERAAIVADNAVKDLERVTQDAVANLRQALKESQGLFWSRTLGVAVIGLLLIAIAAALVFWWLPSLDEIHQREEKLAEVDHDLRLVNDAIDIDGKKWLPINGQIQVCKPKGSANCATFGRLD